MAKKKANAGTVVDVSISITDLADRVKADRLKRRMTWPAYAKFLDVGQATVYKIVRGATKRPHDTTIQQILDRMTTPYHLA